MRNFLDSIERKRHSSFTCYICIQRTLSVCPILMNLHRDPVDLSQDRDADSLEYIEYMYIYDRARLDAFTRVSHQLSIDNRGIRVPLPPRSPSPAPDPFSS